MNNIDKNSGHSGQSPSENHTMPDEIWAQWMPADVGCGEWDKVSLGDDVPYTRTDIYKQVKAERDELLELLNDLHILSCEMTQDNWVKFSDEIINLIENHMSATCKRN